MPTSSEKPSTVSWAIERMRFSLLAATRLVVVIGQLVELGHCSRTRPGAKRAGPANRYAGPNRSSKKSSMARHERWSVNSWYCTPGMPLSSALGLVKLCTAPP
jgi:hypothetical protein